MGFIESCSTGRTLSTIVSSSTIGALMLPNPLVSMCVLNLLVCMCMYVHKYMFVCVFVFVYVLLSVLVLGGIEMIIALNVYYMSTLL